MPALTGPVMPTCARTQRSGTTKQICPALGLHNAADMLQEGWRTPTQLAFVIKTSRARHQRSVQARFARIMALRLGAAMCYTCLLHCRDMKPVGFGLGVSNGPHTGTLLPYEEHTAQNQSC